MAGSFLVPRFQKNPVCRPLFSVPALEGSEIRRVIEEHLGSYNSPTGPRPEPQTRSQSEAARTLPDTVCFSCEISHRASGSGRNWNRAARGLPFDLDALLLQVFILRGIDIVLDADVFFQPRAFAQHDGGFERPRFR